MGEGELKAVREAGARQGAGERLEGIRRGRGRPRRKPKEAGSFKNNPSTAPEHGCSWRVTLTQHIASRSPAAPALPGPASQQRPRRAAAELLGARKASLTNSR